MLVSLHEHSTLRACQCLHLFWPYLKDYLPRAPSIGLLTDFNLVSIDLTFSVWLVNLIFYVQLSKSTIWGSERSKARNERRSKLSLRDVHAHIWHFFFVPGPSILKFLFLKRKFLLNHIWFQWYIQVHTFLVTNACKSSESLCLWALLNHGLKYQYWCQIEVWYLYRHFGVSRVSDWNWIFQYVIVKVSSNLFNCSKK